MMKISLMMNSIFFSIIYLLLMMMLIMICMNPDSPVYYLIYMLIFSFFFILSLSLSFPSNLYMYVFLVVTGGIMVTFLFFLVFSYKVFFSMNIMYFISLILFFMFTLLFLNYYLKFDSIIFFNFTNSNNNIINCYTDNFGMILTFFSMTYLLFIMYMMVKISTFIKSSPMRNLN